MRGAVAGVIVVLGAAVAAWWIWSNGESAGETPAPRNAGLIKEVAPAPAPKAASEPAKTNFVKVVKRKNFPPWLPLVTNEQGEVSLKGPPYFTAEEAADFEKLKRDTTIRTIAEKRLAMIAEVPPGWPLPPMPGTDAEFDASFNDAIKNIIEIQQEDDERDLKVKERVIQIKDFIREEVENGKKPSEALNDYMALVNEVARYSAETLKAARELMASGDKEEAERLIKDVNEELAEYGANPISLYRNKKKRKGNK